MKIQLHKIKEFLKTTKGKFIAVGLSASFLTSGIVGSIALNHKHEHNKKDNNISSSTDVDKIPYVPSQDYVDVNTETNGIYFKQLNDKIGDASFALVDFSIEYDDRGNVIRNSNYDSLSNLAHKCNVEIGYLFNPTSTDRAGMYLAINELKKMMSYYDVNYPIIYNAECLYKNGNEKDKEYNYSILKSFIEKMTENNCYVMVAGSEETLQNIEMRFNSSENNNIDFHNIDKVVFGDVELKDDYCMKIVDGKVTSAYNYTSYINLNGINDESHFVKDFVHTVKPRDSLDTIAGTYDFNQYNIIKYNNKYTTLYDNHTLYNGQQIYIPSKITKNNEISSIRKYNYEAKEKESNLVSLKGVYSKDKNEDKIVDINTNASFALVEYEANFNEDGKKEYITGNYVFQKYTDAKVPFGIVFKPNGVRLGDVYCAIKTLKLYMQTYNIKYPIYYNVDTIFESDNDDKFNYDLSKAFVEKLEYDGCFVGFIGSQDNIKKLRKLYENNEDLDFFNKVSIALYVDKDEEVTYNQNVGLTVTDSEKIVSKVDYEGIITNKKLNNKSGFKDDYAYTVKNDDTLDKISSKFNFAKWNIQMYNPQYDFSKGKVKEGQVIYFPNVLSETEKEIIDLPQIEKDDNGKYYIGIDVSDIQQDIDWEQVKPYIDYAILKFGNGWFFKGFGGYTNVENSLDSKFNRNYSECKRLGIPVGAYVFSNYYMEGDTNYDYEEEAKREADYAAKYLHDNGYTLDLPLYMDYEPNTSNSMYENVTVDEMKNIINIQKEVIESYGYYYGIYTGSHFYNKIIVPTETNCEAWVAVYPSYDPISVNDLEKCVPSYSLSGEIVNNNQISSSGSIPGINARVDINLADEDLMEHCKEFYKKRGN